MILYGAPVREKIKEDLIERIKKLGREPVLAIVQVGDREDSNIYIRQKQKFGAEIGAKVILKKFGLDTNTRMGANDTNVEEEIKKLNADKNVDGIIVQLPLPEGFDTEKILSLIDPKKDADGLAPPQPLPQGEGRREGANVIPATARGVLSLLDFYNIELKGKKAVVIGQGRLAGKPIADELEKRGAEVSRCDIDTENIPQIARNCDILVSATGEPGLVTKEFVNQNQTVIDVGTTKVKEKLRGDVLFEEVEPLVVALTPVPGGVGPLTVACLFANLIDLCN